MTSSVRRLAVLPSIFHANDVALRAGVPADQVNQILWRWRTAGYVQSLGERSDVWFNLVVDPQLSRDRWERAVQLALPSAILAGPGVLMRAGLTTQLSSTDYLIRPANSPRARIDGAQVGERPAIWLRRLVQSGAVDTSGVVPTLDAGAALADLQLFDPASFAEDDIDWEELHEAHARGASSLRLYVQLCRIGGARPAVDLVGLDDIDSGAAGVQPRPRSRPA